MGPTYEQACNIIAQLRDRDPLLVAVAMRTATEGTDPQEKLNSWGAVATEEVQRSFMWLVEYYQRQEGQGQS